MPPEVALNRQWAWVRDAMEAHQSALIRYAHCLLKDGDQARDAVQEAFIKLCRQPREKVENRVFPWLVRVVRNQCLNMLRKEKRMSRFDNPDRISVLEEPAQDHPREQRKRETITSLFELVEEVYEPCPFTIESLEVDGFEASSALANPRLRIKLKDVPGSSAAVSMNELQEIQIALSVGDGRNQQPPVRWLDQRRRRN